MGPRQIEKQRRKLGEREFSRQCREKLRSRILQRLREFVPDEPVVHAVVRQGELPHPPQIGERQTLHVREFGPQISRQLLDHRVAPPRGLLLSYDDAADLQ